MNPVSSYSAFTVSRTGDIDTSPGCLCYLVVVDEFLQFIGMDDNMQAAHLGEAELFPIYTCKTHLEQRRIKSNGVFNKSEWMVNFQQRN